MDEELERVIEGSVERLGFELVDLERAGHRARPLLRLRIDRRDSSPGHGVTVDDCARVSREVEARLDEEDDVSGSYILEVSSPGVERPLRRRRDFERAIGKEIALRGYEPLVSGSRRLEGWLVSVEGEGAEERLRVRLEDETEVEVALAAVARANLKHRWDDTAFNG